MAKQKGKEKIMEKKVISAADRERDTITFDDSFKGKMANKADAAWRELEKAKDNPEALEAYRAKIRENLALSEKNIEKQDKDGKFSEIFEAVPDDSYMELLKTACGVEEDEVIGEEELTAEEEADITEWSETDVINSDFLTPEQLHRSFDLDEDLSEQEMLLMRSLESRAIEMGDYTPVVYNEITGRTEGGFVNGAKDKWKKIIAEEVAAI